MAVEAPPIKHHLGRVDFTADLFGQRTARMKPTARRGPRRTRHIPSEHDSSTPLLRMDRRHGREQRQRVGMQRCGIQGFGRGSLDNPTEIHHSHIVGYVFHDGEIVRDEQVREAELCTKFNQQIDNLSLNRNIERRDRTIRSRRAAAVPML